MKKRSRKPAPQMRNVSLTPTGASLALYHAALSDPFHSPPMYIPYDTRLGTRCYKRFYAGTFDSTNTYFRVGLESNSANGWDLRFYSGTKAAPASFYTLGGSTGKVRITSAAIRVTNLGRNDELGGLSTVRQENSLQTALETKSFQRFRQHVTAHWKPTFANDLLWYGGNEASDNDSYGNFTRYVSTEITSAVATSKFVEFCIIFETDLDINDVISPGNYTVGGTRFTHDAGEAAKDVARRPLHKEKPMHPMTHSHVKGPDHHKRVIDGVKAAMETGASAMAVTEAVKPGTTSSAFKKFLSLGEATEAEMSAAAADALPALEAAYEFAPLAIMI